LKGAVANVGNETPNFSAGCFKILHFHGRIVRCFWFNSICYTL